MANTSFLTLHARKDAYDILVKEKTLGRVSVPVGKKRRRGEMVLALFNLIQAPS